MQNDYQRTAKYNRKKETMNARKYLITSTNVFNAATADTRFVD